MVVVAFSSVICAGYFYAQGTTTQIEGVVVGLHRTDDEEGGGPRFLVKLRGGMTVQVSVDRTVPVWYGRDVVLQETQTRLFGIKRYNFLRHVEQPTSSLRQPDAN